MEIVETWYFQIWVNFVEWLKGAYQPAHQRRLISVYVIRLYTKLILAKFEFSR